LELEKYSPELNAGYSQGTGYEGFVLKCDAPPFDDVNVRRAISIGIDRAAFRDKVGLGQDTPQNWYPLWPGFPETLYTPLEKCPADIQELFEYDTDKAIEMLADAGYPDGFKVELWVTNEPFRIDGASMLADQLLKIGVETTMVVNESLVYRGHQYGRTWNGIMWGGAIGEIQRPETYMARKMLSYEYYNYSAFNSPEMDDKILAMAAELDWTKRSAMIKELAVEMMGLMVTVPVAAGRNAGYAWPWVKNWYGELCVGDHDCKTLAAYIWLDQNLKKEMGY
jgi:peptide/nickel transport system substrate-binding protein